MRAAKRGTRALAMAVEVALQAARGEIDLALNICAGDAPLLQERNLLLRRRVTSRHAR